MECLHVQHIGQRPLIADLRSKCTRLVERGRSRRVVAADAERPTERGQQARLVRAHGGAECRQRPLADVHPFDQPSTPHQLVHHGPTQPTDGFDLSERLVTVQCIVHRAQRIVPTADAAQRHRQSLQQLGTAELIGGGDERKRVLKVADGVVKGRCVECSIAGDR